MIGIIVNAVTSSLAALLGVGLNNRISERFTTAILGVIALGLSAMGIQGAVQSQNLLLVLASMVIGTLIGTAIGIEDRMNQFGEFLKKHLSRGDDSKFVKGFVTLSMMETIGAMAIIGPIQAALGSDDLLYFKSAIDSVSSFIFGALYGIGVVPVGIVLFFLRNGVLRPGYLFYALDDNRRRSRTQRRRLSHDPGYRPQHASNDEIQGCRFLAGLIYPHHLL